MLAEFVIRPRWLQEGGSALHRFSQHPDCKDKTSAVLDIKNRRIRLRDELRLAESANRCAAGSCQSEPTLEARTDRNVKLSASSYFEEARTLSRSALLKNIGNTARGTPLAPGRVRANGRK
jgi:hypothetical protein